MTPINKLDTDELARLTHMVRAEFRQMINQRLRDYSSGRIYVPDPGHEDVRLQKMLDLRGIEIKLVAERCERNLTHRVGVDPTSWLADFPIPVADTKGVVTLLQAARDATRTSPLFVERDRRAQVKRERQLA